MKKILIGILILCAGFLPADQLVSSNYSVALTDDLRAVSINPAALSFHEGSSIAFYQNPGDIFAGNPDFSDNLGLFLKSGNLGWLMGRDEGVLFNTAAVSMSPFTNVYLGGTFGWYGSDLANHYYTLAFLGRPADAVSIGAVYRHNTNAVWEAEFGLGLRPLWFFPALAHRFSLGADVHMNTGGVGLPTIFLEAEPIDGITLSGSFDTEDSTFSIGMGIKAGRLLTGTGAVFSSEAEFSGLDYVIQVNTEKYQSVFSAPGKRFLDYDPGTVLREHPGVFPSGFASLSGSERTVREAIQEIRRLEKDPSISGILFRNQLFQASRTNFHELTEALKDFKGADKKIVFYYENIDTSNYTLAASVADRIYMHPLGMLYLAGTGTIRFYYGDLLSRFGIETVDLQSHEYKTANNSMTKSTMPDAERESLLAVYEGLQEETERRIASGRGAKLSEPVKALFNHGPYLVAEDALEAGLVDGLIYEAELNKAILDEMKAEKITNSIPTEYARRDWAEPFGSEIALIYATGAIYPGEGIPGDSIGSDTLVRALRQARDNPTTKAILLRVDSPGGSALASDIIAREIEICRREPYNLPVVVSMGSVAGSGGYYISCTADYIFAHPDTVTGSIGVAGYNLNIEGLLDMIDVEAVSLFTREKADLGNSTREVVEEETAMFRAYVSHVYDAFIETVARGRNMSREEVHAAGKGRIWTGTQALELGLIDEIGSFEDALDKVRDLAGIDGETALRQYDGFVFDLENMMPIYLSTLVKMGLPAGVVEMAEELESLTTSTDGIPMLVVPYRF